MTTYHPDEALLLDYASGATDEAHALIVATHLSFCAQCRANVAAMETIGGALLDATAPVAVQADALNRALARLETAVPVARPRRDAKRDATPAPLRPYIGDLDAVRWRAIGPNLAYVDLFRRGPVKARLIKGTPGIDPGHHSHYGLEYTMALRGGYTDCTGSYGPGDLQVADASLLHCPIADPGEDCISLAVTTGRLRFQSLLGKIAGPIFGF